MLHYHCENTQMMTQSDFLNVGIAVAAQCNTINKSETINSDNDISQVNQTIPPLACIIKYQATFQLL
jgi:hypothetical protein